MANITDAAARLKDICTRYGAHPAARGATDAEIEQIKQTFVDLEFPLPAPLLDVYKVVLAIPGVLNSEPVLGSPCIFRGPSVSHITFLISQQEEADEEGVLWLGRGNSGDLIIDRDGQLALDAEFKGDGTVRLVDPTDFEAAFLAYVEQHVKEIREEFAEEYRR